MYCQGCGQSYLKEQKFCTTCGSQMLVSDNEIDKDGTPGKMLDNILTAVFLIVLFGMGILVGLVAVLLGNEVKTEVVVMVVMGYLASIFGICWTMLKQIPKLIDARLNTHKVGENNVRPLLQPRTTAKLEEPLMPVESVTDRTTRILERIPNER